MQTQFLRIPLYQPFAHYREPKVCQDDYIASLPLPTPATIAGMLAYVADLKFTTPLQISVCGTYQTRDIQFIRGQNGDFHKQYQTFLKNNAKVATTEPTDEYPLYHHFKTQVVKNRIMNFEVLQHVACVIYVQAELEVLQTLAQALNAPQRYLTLGRKEDFALVGTYENDCFQPAKAEVVTVDVFSEVAIETAIREQLIVKNTYVPKSDEALLAGVLYRLPKSYQDLTANRNARKYNYGWFVYVRDGYYPKGEVYRYENDCFQLIGDE
ncbi:MAG: CRISPR-associated protein Cas5 [Culicoidibacterales bacterium]